MPEGLSQAEIGHDLAKHGASHTSDDEAAGTSRKLTIIEAILLALVAVLAAYSGFASAKWGTESSLDLAKASASHTLANRVELVGLTTKNFDASTFNAWFEAYLLNDKPGMVVAEHRFRTQFDVAFRAWLATHPFTNANAPKGPTYMPEYVQPGVAQSNALDTRANGYYRAGETDGSTSDDYVRTTVFLATVLFLAGISGHFRVRGARIGLIAVGCAILLVAVGLLIVTPKPFF